MTADWKATRYSDNPIISPGAGNSWEEKGAFNPTVVKDGQYHLLYRAASAKKEYRGKKMSVSTIARAVSRNGVDFDKKGVLIKPEKIWERFGCEDPRITRIGDQYLIFYTALSEYPPQARGIRVGVALSKDLKTIDEKHLVTHFNAKAMTLFPQKVNGQYAALLTADTDRPPARIGLACFDKLEEVWSPGFWNRWYKNLNHYRHSVNLRRINSDQVEVGAVPIKTKYGWLVVYAHIQNYYTPKKRLFGIEAVLLDEDNPCEIVARTAGPMITPQANYEKKGFVNEVVFPAGAAIEEDTLRIYYGAADNHCAMAEVKTADLFSHMKANPIKETFLATKYHHNPILKPKEEHHWEANSVFNPAAVYIQDKFYLVYRAQSPDHTSTLGLAESDDGFDFKRFNEPIYTPRREFEQKKEAGRLSGCEDPRITKMDDYLYMFYTAYNGIDHPRVAMTSIAIDDFADHRFAWSEPVAISEFGVHNKNSCLLPEKVNGQYVILHRTGGRDIAVDYLHDLEELKKEELWLEKEQAICPRPGKWDSKKIGIAGPPIKIDIGWLLLYHGVSDIDHEYRVGMMILDHDNPGNVLYRSKYPIIKPTERYERIGDVPNVVFPCGAVLVGDTLFIYYGGGDKVIGMATARLEELLAQVTAEKSSLH